MPILSLPWLIRFRCALKTVLVMVTQVQLQDCLRQATFAGTIVLMALTFAVTTEAAGRCDLLEQVENAQFSVDFC